MTSSAAVVTEFVGGRGGRSRSVNHGYSRSAVCDASSLVLRKEEKNEKTTVDPSLCVSRRTIRAICPSQGT